MKRFLFIFLICIFCAISFIDISSAKDDQPKVSTFLQINRSLDVALFPILRLHIAQNYNLKEPDCIDFNNLCEEVQELTVSFCRKTQIPLLTRPTINIFEFKNKKVSGYILELILIFADLDESLDYATFRWQLKKVLVLYIEEPGSKINI